VNVPPLVRGPRPLPIVIQPTLLLTASRYIDPMKRRPKPSSEQMEESKAPVSPEIAAGARLHGAEGSERNAQQAGSRKEAGRILFGLAVLGAGLLAPNRVRE
jgi:hypothetical protein